MEEWICGFGGLRTSWLFEEGTGLREGMADVGLSCQSGEGWTRPLAVGTHRHKSDPGFIVVIKSLPIRMASSCQIHQLLLSPYVYEDTQSNRAGRASSTPATSSPSSRNEMPWLPLPFISSTTPGNPCLLAPRSHMLHPRHATTLKASTPPNLVSGTRTR